MNPRAPRARIVSRNSKNHEGTTMKKQIDPPIKAHFLWSALMIRLFGASFVDWCSKNSQLRLAAFGDKTMQPPGLSIIRQILFGAMAVGLAASASGSNLAEQRAISPA